MTPKEKAEELFYKMLSTDNVDDYSFVGSKVAKQCALICVDEIIEALSFHNWQNRNEIEYYEEVKQEIEKL